MKLNWLIYDVIVIYSVMDSRVFDTTIHSNLRGSMDPLLKQINEYFCFGADKDICCNTIRKRLDY